MTTADYQRWPPGPMTRTFPIVPERVAIHAGVSRESKAEWDAFVRKNGTTLAALLDVLGRHLDKAFDRKQIDALLDEARDLAHDRRRAGGPRRKNPPS